MIEWKKLPKQQFSEQYIVTTPEIQRGLTMYFEGQYASVINAADYASNANLQHAGELLRGIIDEDIRIGRIDRSRGILTFLINGYRTIFLDAWMQRESDIQQAALTNGRNAANALGIFDRVAGGKAIGIFDELAQRPPFNPMPMMII